MTISHDVVERAARVVLETTGAAKIVSAKHSYETDGTFSELIGTLSLVGKLGGTLVVYCRSQQAAERRSRSRPGHVRGVPVARMMPVWRSTRMNA